MKPLTPEKRAELQRRCVESGRWPTFDRTAVLSLLDALDDKEAELVIAREDDPELACLRRELASIRSRSEARDNAVRLATG